MNKNIIFFLGGMAVGGTISFLISNKLLKDKYEKKFKESLDICVEQLANDPDFKKEETTEVEETETTSEPDISEEIRKHYHDVIESMKPEEDEDGNEIPQEEGETIYEDDEVEIKTDPTKKHHSPRVIGPSREIEDPYKPKDVDFWPLDIFCYIKSDQLLVDENGQIRNEHDTIGDKPRQYGMLDHESDPDTPIYVRNYELETDFNLIVKDCVVTDDFEFENNDSRNVVEGDEEEETDVEEE